MRITPALLFRNASDAVTARCLEDSDILAAYLCGSVLGEEPLLGGATDIDLVFIHQKKAGERQIVRLNADVHLDILHHQKGRYEQARELRQEPWLGYTLYDARPLYDPEHFLDFVQANLRGMFNSHENISARVQSLLKASRKTWLHFHNELPHFGPQQVQDYMQSLQNAANAVACLSGPPLVERRLLLEFPARAEAIGQPGLNAGLLGLLGVGEMDEKDIAAWLPLWQQAFEKVSKLRHTPVFLHQERIVYYRSAIESILSSRQTHAAAWPLLNTWAHMAVLLPEDSAERLAWQRICESLNITGEGFELRIAGLDAYLDGIEELLENREKEWQG